MQLFYGTDIAENIMILSEQESLHCSKVLRMNVGDAIDMTDGKGNFYKGIIRIVHDKRTAVEINETITNPPPSYNLHLYVAMTKHADRLEWMLEKCVELGLTSFTPLITNRTERKSIRVDRMESIALSAMKQSLKCWLPQINEPIKYSELLKTEIQGEKYIAHCIGSIPRKPINEVGIVNNAHFFIGPEGDFTSEEVEVAIKNGFQSINMGPARLRTETAGLIACSFMYLYNINTQDKQ